MTTENNDVLDKLSPETLRLWIVNREGELVRPATMAEFLAFDMLSVYNERTHISSEIMVETHFVRYDPVIDSAPPRPWFTSALHYVTGQRFVNYAANAITARQNHIDACKMMRTMHDELKRIRG